MNVFRGLSQDYDSPLGRVLWPITVFEAPMSNDSNRQWLRDALSRIQARGISEWVRWCGSNEHE
jgi:hypothetical protein